MNDKRMWPRSRAVAIAASLLLAISTTARAVRATAQEPHADHTDHAAAARLVSDAEMLITQAGNSHPLDTAKVREAIAKLQAASNLDAYNDAALVDLGFCYGLIKEPELAIDAYRHATRVRPSAANFKELADIYLRAGSPEDALMAANAGLLKDSHSAGLYNARGMANLDLKRFDDARQDFGRALKLDPSLRVARDNLDALGGRRAAPSTVRKHGISQ